MKVINSYLNVTSVHGLRYCHSRNNSSVVRFVWLTVIGSAFTFCTINIREKWLESQRNPISSTIQSVPASELPFPVVTFASRYQEASWETMQERLLNRLKLDCSNLPKLKCHLQNKELREIAFPDLGDILKAMTVAVDKFLSEIYPNGTENWQCPSGDGAYNVGDEFILRLVGNKEELSGFEKGLQVWLESHISQRKEEKDIEQDLLELAAKFNLSSMSQNCSEDIANSHSANVRLFKAFLIIARSQPKLPWGSLQRTNYSNYPKNMTLIDQTLKNHYDLKFSFEQFFYKLFLKKLENGDCCLRHFPRHIRETLCTSTICSLLPLENLAMKPMDAMKLLSLGIPPFVHDFHQETFDRLALTAKNVLGFDNTSLIPVNDPTLMWLCRDVTRRHTKCPKARLTYTERGYGFSFNLVRKEPLFKPKFRDMLDSFSGPELFSERALAANDEMFFHLRNPGK